MIWFAVAKRVEELEPRWLRTFRAILDAGSFSGAGAALRLSQPAVSAHIRSLESYLGARVLERRRFGRRVHATGPGEALQTRMTGALLALDDLRAGAREALEGASFSLRIGASRTPGIYVVPEVLGPLAAARPGGPLALRIGNSAEVEEMVRENSVDLGVIGRPPASPDLVGRPVFEDRLVLVGPAAAPAARDPVALVSSAPFVLRERGSSTRAAFEAWAHALGIRPRVRLELNEIEAVKRAVVAGIGWTVLSRFAIRQEERRGLVRAVRPPGFPLRRTFYVLVHRAKFVTGSMTSFADALARLGGRASRGA